MDGGKLMLLFIIVLFITSIVVAFLVPNEKITMKRK
jgi:hypothetical protein